MFKGLLCLFILFSCAGCNSSSVREVLSQSDSCQVGAKGVDILFNTLYREAILEVRSGDVVYATSSDRMFKKQLNLIAYEVLSITDEVKDKRLPFVAFMKPQRSSDGSVRVSLFARQSGYEYNGSIFLVCKLEKLVYDKIEYVSAIN